MSQLCREMLASFDQEYAVRPGRKVYQSCKDKPGIVLDCDEVGNLVSLEVLDASKRGLADLPGLNSGC